MRLKQIQNTANVLLPDMKVAIEFCLGRSRLAAYMIVLGESRYYYEEYEPSEITEEKFILFCKSARITHRRMLEKASKSLNERLSPENPSAKSA